MKTLPMPRPLQPTVKLFDLFRVAGTKAKPREGCLSLSQDDVRAVLGVMLLALSLKRVEKMQVVRRVPRATDPRPLTGHMWNLLESRAARALGPGRATAKDLETIEARAITSALRFWRERALSAEALCQAGERELQEERSAHQKQREATAEWAEAASRAAPILVWRGNGLWLGALPVAFLVRDGRLWRWATFQSGKAPNGGCAPRALPKKEARAGCMSFVHGRLGKAFAS